MPRSPRVCLHPFQHPHSYLPWRQVSQCQALSTILSKHKLVATPHSHQPNLMPVITTVWPSCTRRTKHSTITVRYWQRGVRRWFGFKFECRGVCLVGKQVCPLHYYLSYPDPFLCFLCFCFIVLLFLSRTRIQSTEQKIRALHNSTP